MTHERVEQSAPVRGAMLSGDTVLLATELQAAEDPHVTVAGASVDVEVEARWSQAPSTDGVRCRVALVRARRQLPGALDLEVRSAGTAAALRLEPEEGPSDLRTLMRTMLAPMDARARRELLRSLTAAVAALGLGADAPALSASLYAIRQVLRERLPASTGSDDAGRLAVEVLRVTPHRFYVRVTILGEPAEPVSLVAVSPEGERVELAERAVRTRQIDDRGATSLPRHVSVAYVRLDLPSVRDDGWVIELVDRSGVLLEAVASEVRRSPDEIRDIVLRDLSDDATADAALERHVAPALHDLSARVWRDAAIAVVDEHGGSVAEADVSIVVPLPPDVSVAEHQLAQFASDDEVARADLVFVVGAPDDADAARRLLRDLHELYLVPFRVAITNQRGFAVSAWLGAGIACGKKLLLLDPFVIPAQRGWLAQLGSAHSQDGVGAVTGKLLRVDDAIEQAGLDVTMTLPGRAAKQRLLSGLHRASGPAAVPRSVPAAPSSCMMIDRELFLRVGGLRGRYIDPDYDAADLCERLRAQGSEIVYSPAVELYSTRGDAPTSPAQVGAAVHDTAARRHTLT